MNDARRTEIQRALTLIEQAKGIFEVALAQEQEDFDNMPEDLRNDETGQRAEDAIDALERATTCCDDAMSACQEAIYVQHRRRGTRAVTAARAGDGI
jgi:hypothetical protein